MPYFVIIIIIISIIIAVIVDPWSEYFWHVLARQFPRNGQNKELGVAEHEKL